MTERMAHIARFPFLFSKISAGSQLCHVLPTFNKHITIVATSDQPRWLAEACEGPFASSLFRCRRRQTGCVACIHLQACVPVLSRKTTLLSTGLQVCTQPSHLEKHILFGLLHCILPEYPCPLSDYGMGKQWPGVPALLLLLDFGQ